MWRPAFKGARGFSRAFDSACTTSDLFHRARMHQNVRLASQSTTATGASGAELIDAVARVGGPESSPEGARLRFGAAAKRANLRRRGVMPASDGRRDERTTTLPQRLNTVVATCTAEAYDMDRLNSFLKSTFPKVTKFNDEILHLRIPSSGRGGDAFFFADGCFVLWGEPTEISQLLLNFKANLQSFATATGGESETETLFYEMREAPGHHLVAGLEGEQIVLQVPRGEEAELAVTRAMLAFSNGLADSVKLATLENSMDEYIERIKPIPLALANGRQLPVSRAKVLRLTGELLKFRAQLNLHSELTDTPELYWTEPQLEEIYHRVVRVLEIRQRAHMLNKRLDYANELASVLRSHLSERHGLKLEWGIIVLIAVEVAFATLNWVVGLSSRAV